MSIIGSTRQALSPSIKNPDPPSLSPSPYNMDGFLSSRLSVTAALLGAFAVVVAAATITVTRSDEQSKPSILRSSFDVVQSVARYTSSSFQQYSPLKEGDLSLHRMMQCLTLCSLLPGLWFLRSQRGKSNEKTNGSVRSWKEKLKGHHTGGGSIGSADNALRNGKF